MILAIQPTHPVAVILPVYLGVEMTKRCILSAMPGILAIPDARILALNDASPDEGMQTMLEQFAAQWPDVFVVLKNDKNLGFVGTVNRGFKCFPAHDAVLLNSDVVVPKDWLSRLVDEAYSNTNIATVTPFSNNATIASYPFFLEENSQPFNLDVDDIDKVFRQTKLPYVEAPTGVGFCMYIRRACLDQIGYLNEEKFGRGYGEENDLCQRAIKKGWLNIITPNIYAYHEGGVSFSSDKQALVENAMRVIGKLHKNFHVDVYKFIKQDPLKIVRVIRHIQLLSATPIPKVLHISHALGGGVRQHIEDLAHYFNENSAHILLSPKGENNHVMLTVGIGLHTDKLVFDLQIEYETLIVFLKLMGISAVHFHQTIGLDSKILELPSKLGVSHLLTVHDYYWLNGNPTLIDNNYRYPGFYSDDLQSPLYPMLTDISVADWQASHKPLFTTASHIVFPTRATKLFYEIAYQMDNAIVVPHIEEQLNVNKKPAIFTKKAHYTIGVLGAVGREKGGELLEKIAIQAKTLNLPLKFKLIGYSHRSLKSVELTGPYKNKDLVELIKQQALDVVFFPAQWPETYSYTLSYALDSALPIIAPNMGAFPERLSGRENTLLFNHLSPVNVLMSQIQEFIDGLAKGVSIFAPLYDTDVLNHDFYSRDYIEIVSKDLKTSDNNQTELYELVSAHILTVEDDSKGAWRASLLRLLWWLYMHRSMQWLGQSIPKTLRSAIRKRLSNKSIHDIAQG